MLMNIIAYTYLVPEYEFNSLLIVSSFIFVVILAYITTKLLAKSKFVNVKNKNIKVIERTNIANEKQLIIILVNKQHYLLAVDKNNVSILDRLDDFIPIEKQELEFKSFSSILENFKKNRNKDK